MLRIISALLLLLTVPVSTSAGPLLDSAAKAGRELGRTDQDSERRNPGRFWTGLGLLAGGGVLAALGIAEVGDDETGPDDGEDTDDSDDGEDSDGWGNKALLGGGIAAAALGSVLLITGRTSGPSLALQRGRMAVRQTFRF